MSVEVFLRDAPGTQISSSPLITETGEVQALKEMLKEAWESPGHECQVSSGELEKRLPGAIKRITHDLGQSETSTEAQSKIKPYRDLVSIFKEREEQGMRPTAIVRFTGDHVPQN